MNKYKSIHIKDSYSSFEGFLDSNLNFRINPKKPVLTNDLINYELES